MDQKLLLDIRILKFQDYIRRKPERPFGYYGLGVQYLLSGTPRLADKMFMQALKKNPSYAPAKLGKLEVLLAENKFIAAAQYYRKNSDLFMRKKIYAKRIQKTVSGIYSLQSFSAYCRNFRSLFVFDEKIGALQKISGADKQNPVADILLSMYFLKKGRNDEKALTLFNICVGLAGINDRLRWDLIQALSKKEPSVARDIRLAGLFTAIPENAFGTDYANLLISCFMAQKDTDKVNHALSEFAKRNMTPSKKVMWEYINFCNSNNLWNSTLASFCKYLIESGWINGLLARTAIQLKSKGIIDEKDRMFKILSLYGYT
ncbi:hypothetical protein CSTERTH_12855 [Thermoclostridium stercorarium subsp. thermolacticum DSM 2910]|jgi:tetratricopeptide (TPR) repeat protein|uniref:Tetratricopeptide repeat protein n=2 Tax=Thermoclostridium stercorarium TaxID=1510 RepID=A0A1B1YNX0_THEST|nr:hypothetical protein [Thermoclostridium stercorarium]ANW99857.1 hypothetical protein CSTERTH_12855 [Thermoclostridium stercorarium subsp. thermolacticum DSM 2910]ANX02481.1 hypothetical protein CSTERLE_13350 [Thermoclostridium stercorarium subsp. leptospartum DSM 9219]UZQ85568.1 hypothetical protein ODU73_002727 [Thermoclostridium stercorarium]